MFGLRATIGRVRLILGLLALAGCVLGMWFSVLFRPAIYVVVVVLFALWIGLWPYGLARLGSRVVVACLGSIGTCIILMVLGEVIAFVRHDGQEEFGPLLFVPAFMIAMGLPVTILAAIVAAGAPSLLRTRG